MAVVKQGIFSAVFPISTPISTPTPSATPVIGSSDVVWGGSFGPGGFQAESEDTASERIRWSRAWHSATVSLKLPEKPITQGADFSKEDDCQGDWSLPSTSEQYKALEYLISEDSRGRQLRLGNRDENLIEWYTQEVGRHYMAYQLPELLRILSHEGSNDQSKPLLLLLHILQICKSRYLNPFQEEFMPFLQSSGGYEFRIFRERLDALIARSIYQSTFAERLQMFLTRQSSLVLGLAEVGNDVATMVGIMEKDSPSLQLDHHHETLRIMRVLHDSGLGGAQAQQVFAEVMSKLLTAHVHWTYAGQWSSPSVVPQQLRNWVQECFARFAVEVLAVMNATRTAQALDHLDITFTDVDKWKERAICDLGTLRLNELFDVIVEWGNDSRGAIEDLKQYVTTTAARSHLVTQFSLVLSQRLLQPGASTTEILQVYISIIRAFTILDPKGVLLDRLARPIRRYLRDRDDTVKIIVGGLLADSEDDTSNPDALVELAIELNKLTELSEADDDPGDLDWDNMSWVPDPVDAGTDYKKSKNSDVIGTLISLFDSKDIFVKEFQNIMGERLLKKDFEIDREIRVLELLKLRFGEGALQACEVMLRDVLDSRRVDTVISKDQKLNQHSESQILPGFHSKILSRLFWPSLHAETFVIPPEIEALQARYSSGFETLKQSRKLTWLDALGQVSVELQLEDRIIAEEVQTWQAAVIHAFQDSGVSSNNSSSISRTAQDLIIHLEMDEALVKNALTFWVGKLVLRETSPATYTVLETLSPSDLNPDGKVQANVAAAAAAADAATEGAIRSEEEVAMEKMGVFWQFIVGMLTNQGAMPLQRIVMMLKFAVPGGFPFGNEELKEFLGRKVSEGSLEIVGGNYRIVK